LFGEQSEHGQHKIVKVALGERSSGHLSRRISLVLQHFLMLFDASLLATVTVATAVTFKQYQLTAYL